MKLGINIDHIATLRNARMEGFPDILQYLEIVSKNANFVTIHLREDRRHITDADALAICETNKKCFVNFELGLNEEIVNIAVNLRPDAVCIVPEKREELTTESGLNILNEIIFAKTQDAIKLFRQAGIRTSLFLDPNPSHAFMQALQALRPDAVEIHTGRFCYNFDAALHKISPNFYSTLQSAEAIFDFFAANKQNLLRGEAGDNLLQINNFAAQLCKNGFEVHAGHGLKYLSLAALTAFTFPFANQFKIAEISIGHFIIAQSLLEGFGAVIAKIKFLTKFQSAVE